MSLGMVQGTNISLMMTQQGTSVMITYTIIGNYVNVVSNTAFVSTFHSQLMNQTALAQFLNITTTVTYRWITSAFTPPCSANCGLGQTTQTRTVQCQSSQGKKKLFLDSFLSRRSRGLFCLKTN